MNNGLNGFFFNPPIEANYIPHILTEVYKDRIYDRFMPKDKTGTVCLEIGANIGLVSYYFAHYFERVISLEPSSEHFEVLEKNLEQNRLTNVNALKLALSNKNGDATFYHNDNKTMYSLRQEVNSLPQEAETVSMMDMETLFNIYDIDHVDFMKLDCEGFESEIITSASFEKVAPKIKTMLYEWHTWGSSPYAMLNEALRDYGFTIERIPSDATIFVATR